MKWNRYSIKTTTQAVDLISSALDDIGIEGIEIQDNVQLTQEEAKTMFVDFIPELPPDDGTAVVNFYIDSDEDDGTLVKKAEQEIKDLRMFVDIGEGISGLVHISQLSQKRVKSPEEVVKEGDAVTVKIIKVANGKVSLSIKALEEDKEAAKKAEETGVEYTEDAAGTSLGDLLANIKL